MPWNVIESTSCLVFSPAKTLNSFLHPTWGPATSKKTKFAGNAKHAVASADCHAPSQITQAVSERVA